MHQSYNIIILLLSKNVVLYIESIMVVQNRIMIVFGKCVLDFVVV